MMKKYNKLVRDKILEKLDKKNVKYTFHIADENQYFEKLKQKLLEEANEVIICDWNIEELADLQQVIFAICEYKNFSKSDLEKARLEKLQKNWGFEKKIILNECE